MWNIDKHRRLPELAWGRDDLFCGPGCRGFKSHRSPHVKIRVTCRFVRSPNLFLAGWLELRLEKLCDAGHMQPSRGWCWPVSPCSMLSEPVLSPIFKWPLARDRGGTVAYTQARKSKTPRSRKASRTSSAAFQALPGERPRGPEVRFQLPARSILAMHRVLVRQRAGQALDQVHKRKYRRWQRDAPTQLWQLDIIMGIPLADEREAKLVTGIDGREPGSPPWRGPGRAGYAVAAASAGGDRMVGRRGCRAGGSGRVGMAQRHLAPLSLDARPRRAAPDRAHG